MNTTSMSMGYMKKGSNNGGGGTPSGVAGGDLVGSYPNPTVAKVSKSFAFTGIIYDTLTSQQNNYNPIGLAEATTIQLTLTGDQILTGLEGGVAGRIIIIQSGYTGSTDKLTLKNNDAASLTVNRIFCPLSTDFVMSDDNSVILQYDAAQSRWIVIATCQAPYGSTSNTICEGDDARLSNARTPSNHALGGTTHVADTIANVNSKLSDGDMITTLPGEIASLTEETSPAANDVFIIEDSGNSNAKRKMKISTLRNYTFPEFQFFADQLRTPISTDFVKYGSAAATLAEDSLNSALLIRQFDDTTNEAIAFDLLIPEYASNITFYMVHRAQTAPATLKYVYPGIYFRNMSSNAAPGAWSSSYPLTVLTMQASTGWLYSSQTVALSAIGITAGLFTQLQLERNAVSASDDLVGDWNLSLLRIQFS